MFGGNWAGEGWSWTAWAICWSISQLMVVTKYDSGKMVLFVESFMSFGHKRRHNWDLGDLHFLMIVLDKAVKVLNVLCYGVGVD